MGKDEQTLREMAAREPHRTGSAYPVPDHAKSAAQWALQRIKELEERNQDLQNTNEEMGPAYHEWRSHAGRLMEAIRDAVLDYQRGEAQEAWNMLVDLVDKYDEQLRLQQQAKVSNPGE